jgi:Tol biopolymer transport system component
MKRRPAFAKGIRGLGIWFKFTLACLLFSTSCSDFGDEDYSWDGEPVLILMEDSQPDWSPDGTKIVYSHSDYRNLDTTYPSGIYVMDTLGQNRVQIVKGETFSPVWSPNGRYIAFSPGRIVLFDTETHLFRNLTQFGANYPRWSPDGTRISCTRGGDLDTVGIWLVDVATGQSMRWGYGGANDWSPSGEELIDATYFGGYRDGLYKTSVADPGSRRVLSTGEGSYRRPRFSPDGKTVAWTHFPFQQWYRIVLIDTSGQNERVLTIGKDPSWSPVSQSMMFCKLDQRVNRVFIYKIDMPSGRITQITW